VLIVDDDPGMRTMLVVALNRAGYEVEAVGSGDACLALLREGYRGVILMDIMMPGLDGWDTIRAMVEEGLYEGNAVCMLTGVMTPGPKAEGLQEYVMDYLTKPVQITALLDMVREAANCCAG
jgi:DNA-binding response OmpR family regulator